MESGAKFREQRKKEGESEETVRVREEDFFLVDSVPISSHPFFSAHFFFFGPSPLPKRWTRLPPAGAGRLACGRKKVTNQNLMRPESRDHCFAIFKLILMK